MDQINLCNVVLQVCTQVIRLRRLETIITKPFIFTIRKNLHLNIQTNHMHFFSIHVYADDGA